MDRQTDKQEAKDVVEAVEAAEANQAMKQAFYSNETSDVEEMNMAHIKRNGS